VAVGLLKRTSLRYHLQIGLPVQQSSHEATEVSVVLY